MGTGGKFSKSEHFLILIYGKENVGKRIEQAIVEYSLLFWGSCMGFCVLEAGGVM